MQKKYIFKVFTFFLLIMLLHFSCSNPQKEVKKLNPQDLKDPLLAANTHMVKVETEDINNYIQRHEWSMQQTGTGLRYMIFKNGNGRKVVSGDKVIINYKVNLINGILCYSSKEDGPLEFITGNAEVINGLEEAILLLREGDRAKIIIPSHLAYGLLGDEDKIPKRATLVYDVEVVRAF